MPPLSPVATLPNPPSTLSSPIAPNPRNAEAGRRFADALASALRAQQAVRGQATPGVGGAEAASTDARARARETLNLGAQKPTSASASGDVILQGIEKMRGALDSEQSRLLAAMKGPFSGDDKVFAVEAAVARYSLVMQLSSKLVGKSTQTFDTLLKNQ